MSEFQFREIDSEGRETLDVISDAENFNKWMYETIKPFCKGKVLEVGSGIGNISSLFIGNKFNITLSDIRENYCAYLKREHPDVNVLLLDLTHPDFDQVYADQLNQYDTVFALNVVEHIKDDSLALRNCNKLLTIGGNLIILVPAYQSLYNRFDQELEHYRRYTRKNLGEIFRKNEFQIINSRYFNFMGIPGWYVSGKLQGNKTIPKSQMQLYNKLVPIFRLVDKIFFNRIGLSVINVGVKVKATQ